jgi:hypothetical protein
MAPLGTPGGLAPARLGDIRSAAELAGTGALVGVVTDEPSGLGVQRADVILLPLEAQGPTRKTSSDSTGGFWLDRLAPGAYQLLGRRIVTHRTRLDTVRLRAGIVDTARLSLARYDSIAFMCGVRTGPG